jgi:SAM-dependent methyltransferase
VIVPPSAVPFIRLQRTRVEPFTEYPAILAAEAAALRQWLPARASSLVDVGCGVAGIDALLYHALGAPTLHLVDRTQSDRPRYGFGDRAFYSSLEAARELLEANGVPAGDIHAHEAPPDWGAIGTVDVALSLLSMGFHYPVSEYADAIADALAPGGVLVLDVRHGTGGREALAERFEVVGCVVSDRKRERLACRVRP